MAADRKKQGSAVAGKGTGGVGEGAPVSPAKLPGRHPWLHG